MACPSQPSSGPRPHQEMIPSPESATRWQIGGSCRLLLWVPGTRVAWGGGFPSFCELSHTELAGEKPGPPASGGEGAASWAESRQRAACTTWCFLLGTPLAPSWLAAPARGPGPRASSQLAAGQRLIAFTITFFPIFLLWALISARCHC